MHFISEFHRNGKLTKGINSTFIALIPKIDSPQRLNDFRPISPVGSLYKILAKVLAKRLRLVIGSVISESQTAFVKDRQILDGILIANEVVDEARKSKKDLMLFKVDFEKSLRFGGLGGLRQGDPLSPFHFLLAAEGLNVLMEVAVARNFFTGYSVCERNPVSVSHLQFADDTLLLGVKSWVNFHKSMLAGVNIPDSWIGEAASALCCLHIGGDPRRMSFWELVLTRLQNRLSRWKSRFLSFGGHLVLIKYVLTSLPVYALSFFKAPSGKWCWRMLVDIEGLWFRVLVARYGVERGRLRDGGRRGFAWWREIERIREGGELGGTWFGEHVSKKAGDVSDTFFWTDPWVEGIPLCEWFARLFDLTGNKLLMVAEMFSLGWGTDGEAWEWRRQLLQLLWMMQINSFGTLRPQVPLKVSIFARRLLHDSTFGSLWTLVCSWIDITPVHSTSIRDHFVQQVDLGRGAPFCSSFGLYVVGLCGRKEITDYLGG
ncbi:hypothetical protein TSUD_98820 [Trifolium subterraneum]|uniref:Uncharacterized protein n=1 Tax=Trifolium subterraneum TaxID=3900 RepID=A0A2Z6NXD6_TRISU|nr:hypothetical protein TSUD_98820 [Trifolium subterraneum]